MRIRKMKKTDYAVVDGLLLQLQELDVDGRPDLFKPMKHYMPQETFENLLQNKNISTYLAFEHGLAVGCCFVSELEKRNDYPIKISYIDLLVVDKKYRRQGIGKRLFEEVRKAASRSGVKRIELMVWSHNTDAMKAYEFYGMKPQRSIYEISV